ncbi:unnamed protein product [Moneuplotes crassus]|uniref:Uncharacterized protein n=1 Tax=Euplotes crassus TaxID=5936 RepID=A0AAD1UQH9_EUPCR|nr:unnamed protein product [Moneuplotes crassus]
MDFVNKSLSTEQVQIWDDMNTGRKYKYSMTSDSVIKSEINRNGTVIVKKFFPQITGRINNKQRLELSKSTKFSTKSANILPKIKACIKYGENSQETTREIAPSHIRMSKSTQKIKNIHKIKLVNSRNIEYFLSQSGSRESSRKDLNVSGESSFDLKKSLKYQPYQQSPDNINLKNSPKKLIPKKINITKLAETQINFRTPNCSTQKAKDSILIKTRRNRITTQDTYDIDTKTNWFQTRESPKIRDNIEQSLSSCISKLEENRTITLRKDSCIESDSSDEEKITKVHGNFDKTPIKLRSDVLATIRHDTPPRINNTKKTKKFKYPKSYLKSPSELSKTDRQNLFKANPLYEKQLKIIKKKDMAKLIERKKGRQLIQKLVIGKMKKEEKEVVKKILANISNA